MTMMNLCRHIVIHECEGRVTLFARRVEMNVKWVDLEIGLHMCSSSYLFCHNARIRA